MRCPPWLLLLCLCWLCSGCLVSHSRKKIVREDEIRRDVVFQSPESAEKFNALASDDSMRNAEGSSSNFGIPFLVGFSHASVPSQNAYYNDQISKCDTDGDGFLSDAEVQAFVKR